MSHFSGVAEHSMSFPNLCAFHCLTDKYNTHYIRKWLLRSATFKRFEENKKLASDLGILENKVHVKANLGSLDWTILTRHLKKNVDKQMKKINLTHQKKLRNLTKNSALGFMLHETVTNLSSYRLSDNELDILNDWCRVLNQTITTYAAEILATFEMIHQEMRKNLRKREHSMILKIKVANLARITSQHIMPQHRI